MNNKSVQVFPEWYYEEHSGYELEQPYGVYPSHLARYGYTYDVAPPRRTIRGEIYKRAGRIAFTCLTLLIVACVAMSQKDPTSQEYIVSWIGIVIFLFLTLITLGMKIHKMFNSPGRLFKN